MFICYCWLNFVTKQLLTDKIARFEKEKKRRMKNAKAWRQQAMSVSFQSPSSAPFPSAKYSKTRISKSCSYEGFASLSSMENLSGNVRVHCVKKAKSAPNYRQPEDVIHISVTFVTQLNGCFFRWPVLFRTLFFGPARRPAPKGPRKSLMKKT